MAEVVGAAGLAKSYPSGVRAVAGVDLDIGRGEVYGVVGLNGAGKSTLFRLLLGLARPTEGIVRVFGGPPGTAAGRVGAMTETGGFYPHLTGRQNVALMARLGGLGRGPGMADAVQEALVAAGLADRADRRFGEYSLGMRQRVGLAVALCGHRELLVLDEPTNGLDPAGIAEVRGLVRERVDAGATVLLASHLLTEVEQVCDRVGLLHRGRLVAEGPPGELAARVGGLLVRAEPAAAAIGLLRAHPAVREVEADGAVLRVAAPPAQAAELNRALVAAGVAVHELRPAGGGLEAVLLRAGLLEADASAGGIGAEEVPA
ncbi:ABC transporter ATP-binding protein [Pseudonocardia humida]|uniref:ABC transporter ATP-binding protein n=1 Tax=Pseudonocardia humida TaxID=2800819 RepID=A0ABT1A0U9_9PSEU|nr:ATP-binding cassette domain-containing protein [Pseudonocardia humida]MCO1656619.1 ABC transporter ATP-binding protein [Pseudonocardia humida]